jgi:tetratricopeptide (TPR) repeat protein
MDQLRYHLGRGRRARDAGRFEDGAAEARKALQANPRSAWALALFGQCLFRQREPDLRGARQALERAHVLESTNGYFVRLLLAVLDAQGDVQGRADLLARAWWQGAPVERWLPEGPPMPRRDATLDDGEIDRHALPERPAGTIRATSWAPARGAVVAGRQPVGA